MGLPADDDFPDKKSEKSQVETPATTENTPASQPTEVAPAVITTQPAS